MKKIISALLTFGASMYFLSSCTHADAPRVQLDPFDHINIQASGVSPFLTVPDVPFVPNNFYGVFEYSQDIKEKKYFSNGDDLDVKFTYDEKLASKENKDIITTTKNYQFDGFPEYPLSYEEIPDQVKQEMIECVRKECQKISNNSIILVTSTGDIGDEYVPVETEIIPSPYKVLFYSPKDIQKMGKYDSKNEIHFIFKQSMKNKNDENDVVDAYYVFAFKDFVLDDGEPLFFLFPEHVGNYLSTKEQTMMNEIENEIANIDRYTMKTIDIS